MATTKEISVDDLGTLFRDSRLSPIDMAERLGHSPYAARRWGCNLPFYADVYLKMRTKFYEVNDHLVYGTVPDDFNFLKALKELKLKKIDLAKALGVSHHTVGKWGNEPPLYAKEIVYTMYLLKGVIDIGRRDT